MKKELKLRKKYIESNCSHKVIKENIKTNSKTYLNSMPYILHLTSDLRGITLIALIITIIVMLILVGVTVSITINGGLFDKSKQAVDEYVITQEKEQVELAYVSAALNKSEDNVSADELQNELIKSVGKDKTLTTDNGDGTLTVFFADTKHYYIVNQGNVSEITVIDEINIKETESGNINVLVSNVTKNSVTVYTDEEINNAQNYIYYYKSSGSSKYIYGGKANSHDEQITISGLNSKTTYKVIVVVTDKNEKIIEKSQNIATIITYDKALLNQIYSENRTYIDNNGFTANIPSGAKVISENTSSVPNGLVIDLKGSQFVWIPVYVAMEVNKQDAESTKALATLDENGNYTGIFYTFNDDGTSTILNSTNQEPASISMDEKYLYIINNILGTNYSNIEEWLTEFTSEYNNMIKSVNHYGGFYIARYETSVNSDEVAVSIKDANPIVAKGVTLDRNNGEELKWYGLYALHKSYAKDIKIESVSSSMVWGSQWDALLNCVLNGQDAYKVYTDVNGSNFGKTGRSLDDVVMNIYDLQGNYMDFTLERSQMSFRVTRGNLASNSAPMSHRAGRSPYSTTPDNPLEYITSRLSLYIK